MRCIFFIQQLFLSSQRIHHRALSVTAYDKFLHLSDGMHFSTQQITTSNLELYHILDYWKTLPSMSTGSPSSKYKPIGEHRHCCVTFKATVPMLIFRAWATCGMSQLIHKCRKNHVINSSRHLFPEALLVKRCTLLTSSSTKQRRVSPLWFYHKLKFLYSMNKPQRSWLVLLQQLKY